MACSSRRLAVTSKPPLEAHMISKGRANEPGRAVCLSAVAVEQCCVTSTCVAFRQNRPAAVDDQVMIFLKRGVLPKTAPCSWQLDGCLYRLNQPTYDGKQCMSDSRHP